MSNCAIILAGGEGKRMKSNLPKPMSEVLGKPMLRWVIDSVKSAGVDDICVVKGYKKECIEQGKKYFSVASGGGTGRTLHPDNMAAGPASYGMTDTMGRMHSDAQFAGSSSVPAHVEMMGLIGAGNNPMVGMTVAVAVSIEEAAKAGKF